MKAGVWWLAIVGLTAAVPVSADQWEKTFALSGRPDLKVVTGDGSVSIEAWDRRAVEVRVTTTHWRIGPDVHIEHQQKGNQLEVRVHRPRRWGFDFGLNRRSIQVQISVPHEANLNVETGDGTLRVSSVSGRITLQTGDGQIDVESLKGEIALSSGDGGIMASDLDGALRAHTGDGRVRVAGRFDAVNLTTGDGSINFEARKGSRLGEDWSVLTGDGLVNLRIPGNLDAALDVSTNDGHIDLDLPVRVEGVLGHHTIRGALNRGGPVLKIRTGDGSIRIGES